MKLLLAAMTLAVAFAFSTPKPLTSADLIQMKTAGFDDQTIINAIAANGVAVDTSVQGLISLKQSGLSKSVIDAVLGASAPKPSPTTPLPSDSGVPDEIGAYAVVRDVLTPLPVEVVNFKTAGTLAMAFTYGIKKAKFQGTVTGASSPARLTLPVTLILHCADGTAPNEYQLVPLDTKKDSREFTEAKMGFAGASGGVNDLAVSLKFEKIGRNTYKATASEMKRGQYGFLAPGALATANGASNGKLYTFGVVE